MNLYLLNQKKLKMIMSILICNLKKSFYCFIVLLFYGGLKIF